MIVDRTAREKGGGWNNEHLNWAFSFLLSFVLLCYISREDSRCGLALATGVGQGRELRVDQLLV